MTDMLGDLYIEDYSASVGAERGYGGYRNALRIKKFLKLINPHPKEKILEIGCNRGLLLSRIKEVAPSTIGIDVNQEMVHKLNNPAITYMSATNLKFPKETFDKVCAFEVIEHIENLSKVFEGVYKILKKGGVFIVSFPVELIRGQTAILDAWNVYRDLRYARKLHLHKLRPSKILKIAEPLGFQFEESKTMLIPFPSYVMKLKK